MAGPAGRARPGGILSPLRRRLFRAVWGTNLVSNFGWLIQAVGAAWLMTSLTGRADMVALVQTATQAPIPLVALFAGVAADIWGRRAVLLVAQAWMVVAAAALALLTLLGLTGPVLLLLLTFLLGVGAALNTPAMQAAVRELVPTRQLAAAVTVNAVAFNIARSVGPALGGLIVALAGPATAFLLNALSSLPLMAVLWRWRGRRRRDDLPRERVGGAILSGLRYVGQTRPIQRTLARGAVFAFAAAAVMALLPLFAREQLAGGPVLYGVLLCVFGAGALGGAFLIHPLRHRLGTETMVTLLSAVLAAALLAIGLVPTLEVTLAAMPLAGAAWLGSFSSFNISIQLASAFWVQGRVLSLYQVCVFGTMALASWAWGWVAHLYGMPLAFAAAGGLAVLSAALHLVLQLPGGQAPDLRPAAAATPPAPRIRLDPEEGPVLVLVEYRVAPESARPFMAAMEEVGHLRRRNGALHWQLYQDTALAERWVETFTLRSWLEHLRQTRRATAADLAIEAEALRWLLPDTAPEMRRLLHREPENMPHSG